MIRTAAVLLGLALVVPALSGAERAPEWLRAAASLPVPDSLRGDEAVVLLREQAVQVGEDGSVRIVERRAVRVGTAAGKQAAAARVVYRTDTGRVLRLQAWLIRPSGAVESYVRNRIVDVALLNDDVYNEVRVQNILAGDAAEPGSVFGYEAESEDRTVFTQFEWYAQDRMATLRSGFSVAVPAGWAMEHRTFNRPPLEPTVSDRSWRWQVENLPRLEDEPGAPPATALVARVAAHWRPSTEAAGEKALQLTDFVSWADVAGWLADLSAAPSEPTGSVSARARQLVASARSELDSIRAIGRFVQRVRYASISMGTGRGGGYRPHDADDVLAKSYGDCKDKASLMRAMLRSVGIPAWLVVVSAGDPDYVRPEWPSPHQFDHCIVGVGTRTGAGLSACVRDPVFDTLLIFDPTDPNTVLGDLPSGEQGGLALVVSHDTRELLRLPAFGPAENRLERRASVALAPDGRASGSVRESSIGQAAAAERRLTGRSAADYREIIESWMAQGVGGPVTATVSMADDSASGRFVLDVGFEAPRFAQRLPGGVLAFRPAMVSRSRFALADGKPRRLPIELKASAFRESVIVALPAGFVAEELPAPVSLESSFGRYSSSYVARAGEVLGVRSLEVLRSRVPAERCHEVRAFFDRVRAAENAAVLVTGQQP